MWWNICHFMWVKVDAKAGKEKDFVNGWQFPVKTFSLLYFPSFFLWLFFFFLFFYLCFTTLCCTVCARTQRELIKLWLLYQSLNAYLALHHHVLAFFFLLLSKDKMNMVNIFRVIYVFMNLYLVYTSLHHILFHIVLMEKKKIWASICIQKNLSCFILVL
jgi:hypothetical protein